ncbi:MULTISPECIES: hypothetical protein, partial [Klebsiella]|uniref:hypothetical protein n=1 Tax=Klebsiella TaxID=570 RepID=UPI002869EE6A
SAASGETTRNVTSAFPRLAQRLAGLQAPHRLHAGSPDKARQAPPPGKQRAMQPPLFPGSRYA